MRIKARKSWLLLVLLTVFLSGCFVEIERVQITVHDDLSSAVQVIALQSTESYDRQIGDGDTPELDQLKTGAVECGFDTKNYLARSDYYGFTASAAFDRKEELEFALSCMPMLGPSLKLHPLKVNEGPWDVNYELQIEIDQDAIQAPIHEVRVSLPGKMEPVEPIVPTNITVTSKTVGSDTVVWQLPTMTTSLPPGPRTVIETAPVQQLPTQVKLRQTPAETTPKPEGSSSIHLIARSHKSNIRSEWILSILGILFGSGTIWQLVKMRQKSTTSTGAGTQT